MSVQSYLSDRASRAILAEAETRSIKKSIETLKSRLGSDFKDQLDNQFQFGSSTRGTILPRKMDSHSDIDYMIVFKDKSLRPQTYIERLKRFANKHYSTSEIHQSHPTVVLKLNHIHFDLVPAINGLWGEYQIPAPLKDYMEWTDTSPKAFDTELTTANVLCDSKLKPAIRLLKYWNVLSDYVYPSFSLEKWAANRCYLFCSTVRDYFFNCIENLDLDWSSAQWRKDKVARAKTIIVTTKQYEENGMVVSAELEIKKLIP